ncbi:glycosyltransferase [Amnibacterium sp.]|uniref:glycosyltransferase family 2 protein n=1 Tax=Amnibacterium sp. TaxID=1872496 RepID=UPI003F7CD10A
MTRRAKTNRHAAGAMGRSTESATAQSPTMVLFVLLGVLGIIAYGSFLLNPANRGDLLPWLLVIGAESVLVATALLSMWTILAGSQDPRDYGYHRAKELLFDGRLIRESRVEADPRLWPLRVGGESIDVDVFITTYGEDVAVIRRTVQAAVAMHGRHRTFVLDDGHSDEVRRVARSSGAHYLRRADRAHAKAGNINAALARTSAPFFVILDADFVPAPQFLTETLPFFARRSVAFVQTPQTYGNLTNFISRGAGYMQTVFYKLIQPGRNRFNAAFCVGTNVMFRRTAIEDIGGMYTASKSEDVWTSLMLHERGWRSVFLPEVLAIGDAPETIAAYAKQQLRWATGGFEILLTHNPLGFRRRLTLDQRLQYLATATHYLTGIATALLLLVPPLEIFLDLRPMNLAITPLTWGLYYAGFYLLQIGLAFYAVGSFRFETLLLSACSFPIYLKALTNVLTGKKTAWSATGAAGSASSPFNYIVPQMLTFLFLAITSAVGLWRDLDNGVFTLASAWNITNTLIIGSFLGFAARESARMKREVRVARRLERVSTSPVSSMPGVPVLGMAPAEQMEGVA